MCKLCADHWIHIKAKNNNLVCIFENHYLSALQLIMDKVLVIFLIVYISIIQDIIIEINHLKWRINNNIATKE